MQTSGFLFSCPLRVQANSYVRRPVHLSAVLDCGGLPPLFFGLWPRPKPFPAAVT